MDYIQPFSQEHGLPFLCLRLSPQSGLAPVRSLLVVVVVGGPNTQAARQAEE